MEGVLLEENNFKCGKIFCNKCEKATNGAGEVQQEVMCDEVETVKRFCYLGNRLNVNAKCEAAVTARTRMGWKKFSSVVRYYLEKILFVDERKDI